MKLARNIRFSTFKCLNTASMFFRSTTYSQRKIFSFLSLHDKCEKNDLKFDEYLCLYNDCRLYCTNYLCYHIIILWGCGGVSLDVAIVLDLSSADFNLIYSMSLPFIRHVVNGLPTRPDKTRIAFITAVDAPSVQFYLNTYRWVAQCPSLPVYACTHVTPVSVYMSTA